MIFCDFDGFPQISQFLHTVLAASTMRIGSTCVHFRGVLWIRSIFWSKSTNISALGAKCYRYVIKSDPGVKIILFSKVPPTRARNMIFRWFCRVLIDEFLRFWRISTDFAVFAYGSDRFQEANRFKMCSFLWFLIDLTNFRINIHKFVTIGSKYKRNVTGR